MLLFTHIQHIKVAPCENDFINHLGLAKRLLNLPQLGCRVERTRLLLNTVKNNDSRVFERKPFSTKISLIRILVSRKCRAMLTSLVGWKGRRLDVGREMHFSFGDIQDNYEMITSAGSFQCACDLETMRWCNETTTCRQKGWQKEIWIFN